MTIAMLRLAGIPATAGFIGKFQLIEAAVDGGYTWLGIVIVIGSMISLAYYLRVVAAMWRDEAQPAPAQPGIDPAHRPRGARRRRARGATPRPPAPAAGRRSSSRSSWAPRSSSSASSRSRCSTSCSTPPRASSACASGAPAAADQGRLPAVRISAKADYAVRAAAELAAAGATGPSRASAIATAQDIPLKFLENILSRAAPAGHRARAARRRRRLLARPARGRDHASPTSCAPSRARWRRARRRRPSASTYTGAAEPLPRDVDRAAREPAQRARARHARRPRGRRAARRRSSALADDPEAWVKR